MKVSCWIREGKITNYIAPGVYRTVPAPSRPPLALVRTDIAAFIGFAERGPVADDLPPGFAPESLAVRLTSWAQFQSIFGGYLPNGALAFAVLAFFANGGTTCYVTRVAASAARVTPDKQPLAAVMPLPAGPAVAAGTLAAPGAGFAARLALNPRADPAALIGQLISVRNAGLAQDAVVLAQLADGGFLLSAPLDPGFAAGDAVLLNPPAAVISARSRGAWGNRIRLDFTALDAGAFGLRVTVDTGPVSLPTEQEFYPRLTPATAGAVLAAQSNLIDFSGDGTTLWFGASGPLGPRSVYLAGGRDGLADVTLADFTGGAADRRGLALLEEIDEVAMLAIPDAVLNIALPAPPPPVAVAPCAPPPVEPLPVLPPDPTGLPAMLSADDRLTLQMLMIEQCERLNYRVALLDPPFGLQPEAMAAWPDAQGLVNRSAQFAALYYPWLAMADPTGLPGAVRLVPPSGHAAGTYAQNDLTRGVQHPPANIALVSVCDVAQAISETQSGLLNASNVNAIRAFPGRGIRLWGARSLAADAAWRFIHVRRLVSAIEETAQRSSRWAVFETHNAALRFSLTHALTVLLEGIWAQGGLQGATPAEGFYVKCDAVNNPQAVIDAGQLICEIGVAVAAPMEFIVFQIRQDVAGTTVTEA
jgi:hypothetical protein